LAKWRWKLLDNTQAVWKDVIRGKYGVNAVGKVELGDDSKPWYSSLWWKDICTIGTNLEINWFSRNVVKIVGNGEQTSFWWDVWVGEIPLKDRFPRLFLISNQKSSTVAEVRSHSLAGSLWRFDWRRRFFVWEEELLEELKEVVDQFVLRVEPDRWGWRPGDDAIFTVKSTYSMLSRLPNLEGLNAQWHAGVFKAIWKSPTPSKVCGFV
jgi:hypothetical protein